MMAGAPFVSRLSWAAGSPMQKLQYAAIGLGGRGMFDVQSISRHEKVKMIAGADVDSTTAKKMEVRMEDVKTFSDWREMFEIMGKDIDVVSVSTPDHMHGIMAMSAMNLGKHAYDKNPRPNHRGMQGHAGNRPTEPGHRADGYARGIEFQRPERG